VAKTRNKTGRIGRYTLFVTDRTSLLLSKVWNILTYEYLYWIMASGRNHLSKESYGGSWWPGRYDTSCTWSGGTPEAQSKRPCPCTEYLPDECRNYRKDSQGDDAASPVLAQIPAPVEALCRSGFPTPATTFLLDIKTPSEETVFSMVSSEEKSTTSRQSRHP